MKKDTPNQEKKAGHFNLFPLLAHVAKTPGLIPWGKSEESKKYRREVDKLLDKFPKERPGGWYVWGRFNDAAWFQPIYIGMSSPKKKAGLRQRLYDELTKECLSIFATVYGRDAIMTAARKHFKYHQENHSGHMDYFKKGEPIQRILRRTDAHFVIWVATGIRDEDNNFEKVESALINLYRPANNSKRSELHKEIPHGSMLKQEVERVQKEIEKEISDMSGDFGI